MERIENEMQREIGEVLRSQFGKAAVTREKDFADIRVTGKRELLIEVKADTVARRAIRDALGQLLFYAYRDGKPRVAPELVVIGRGALQPEDERFLATLRRQFGLDVTYRRYLRGSRKLSI
jgi:hypothetical protein